MQMMECPYHSVHLGMVEVWSDEVYNISNSLIYQTFQGLNVLS